MQEDHQFWKYLSDPKRTETLQNLSFLKCQTITRNIMVQIVQGASKLINLKQLKICEAKETENAPYPEVCHAFVKV